MATGSDYVTDAMAEIGYLAAESAIQPSDMQLGIRKLNDMMSAWELSGAMLGFTPLSSEADEVTVERGLKEAIVMNLAGRLASAFVKPITPTLAASIQAATKTILRYTVKIGEVNLPSTLPKGDGNHQEYYRNRFFAETNKKNF